MAAKGNTDVSDTNEISRLLRAWSGGDGTALDRLAPLVYPRLRALARQRRRNERAGHTLNTTALVNEAFVRLVGASQVAWQDRAHFFAFTAQLMRRILIDAARARSAAKRGGGIERADRVVLDDLPGLPFTRAKELVALDEALQRLAKIDARKAEVVELRFFGGVSVEECAETLKVSPQTVMRDWRLARVWLA